MRLQWQSAGSIRVLNDAYNANPHSMRAALDTAAALHADGRRVAVLGDMKELGQSSERYHKEIGQAVAASKAFDVLVCVGQQASLIADTAIASGLPPESVT